MDPRDLDSLPNGLGANDETHVPLPPRREPLRRAPPWIRRLRDAHRLVLNFCYSDHGLLRWDALPGAAEQAVRRWSPAAALTLDVPLYGFMTQAQRERANARMAAAILRAVRTWEPAGIETVPLVKGLDADAWRPQLGLARELGLRRCAFHARELILEHNEEAVRAFVREAHRHGLRPILLGAFRWRSLAAAIDAAASHHYVLARRGRILDRAGRVRKLQASNYSDLLRAFLRPGDVGALTSHNFLRARALLSRPAPLSRFAS
ncbi:MAG: hypothetical protein HYT80_04010 [Euryarchaeota archaeon]|nr:hypothetical protein [Euryarchaeota archaeon]